MLLRFLFFGYGYGYREGDVIFSFGISFFYILFFRCYVLFFLWEISSYLLVVRDYYEA